MNKSGSCFDCSRLTLGLEPRSVASSVSALNGTGVTPAEGWGSSRFLSLFLEISKNQYVLY